MPKPESAQPTDVLGTCYVLPGRWAFSAFEFAIPNVMPRRCMQSRRKAEGASEDTGDYRGSGVGESETRPAQQSTECAIKRKLGLPFEKERINFSQRTECMVIICTRPYTLCNKQLPSHSCLRLGKPDPDHLLQKPQIVTPVTSRSAFI